MRLTYDPVADAAMLYFVEGATADRSEVLETSLKGSAVILDYDQDGKVIGIEFLGAAAILRLREIEAVEWLER